MLELSFQHILLRLGAAILLGGLLGLERELSGKPAGLRTHMLVALGAAAFSVVTLEVYAAVAEQATRADPLRIVEGIIGGIGFLGAGTIIRSRGSVEGITTAASIWVVGGIGLACGVGLFPEAAVISVLALIIVSVMGRVGNRFFRNVKHRRGRD